MAETVKITMIGGKNVGKTCFMHGMYAVMQRGVHNFFLHANDPNDDNRLIQGWAALSRRGNERKWPVPTNTAISRHTFQFKRGMNHKVMDFEWIDYRGGALLEDKQNVDELVTHLNASDCLLYCVDGGDLKEPLGSRYLAVDHRNCISRAKVLLDSMTHRVPIVVVITKHDLCAHRNQRELLKDVETLFDSWLIPGEGWEVMICPVSLGGDLARDREMGEIDPKNLHLPIIYAIFSITVGRLVTQERKNKRARSEHEATQRKVRTLGRTFLTELLNRTELEKARHDEQRMTNDLRRQNLEIVRLRRDVALLRRELTSAILYSDGERVIVG